MKNELTPEPKQMLSLAAAKLGISPQELENKLRSGNAESLLRGNSKLAAILSDRKAMEQLMNSPQAQALLKALTKSSGKG